VNVSPFLSVAIVSFNRLEYLRELLTSLRYQDSDEEFELIILDNGSKEPVSDCVKDILSHLTGPVRVVREERNLLSPNRWKQAFEAASGEFVLVPGDDDILMPHYISRMAHLARSSPSVTMVSVAVQNINSSGRRLGSRITPPDYRSQPDALGHLLVRDDYPMPGSAFRRSAVDLRNTPMTRSAFDWWLWWQCWLSGNAATSADPAVYYRQHVGQEQRHYGMRSFRNDAARMQLSVLNSEPFRRTIDSWSRTDLEKFCSVITSSPGPVYGDTRWGPLLQMALSDILRDRIPVSTYLDLYSQAAGQAGSIASVGELQALAGQLLANLQLPKATWSRIPISANWSESCVLSEAWKSYLQLPTNGHERISAQFSCSCANGNSRLHEILLTLSTPDLPTAIKLVLPVNPTDAVAAPVLEAIGTLTGRPHGFEIPSTLDLKVLASFSRFRMGRIGSATEMLLRWARDHRFKSRNNRRS